MFSPTGVANFLVCEHLTTLDRAESCGEIARPYFADPGAELLRILGLRHEQAYLSSLRDHAIEIVEIQADLSWADAVARTKQAIGQGVGAIYQATLEDTPWIGRADFLVRVDTPSQLGSWSYEVVETKLTRSTKARALIQLCFYSDLLSRIQGMEPAFMHVVLGGNVPSERFSVKHYVAYFRRIKREYEQAVGSRPNTYPEPVEHCDVCDWFPFCDERWRVDDYLSLVAGITRKQRKALVERDVRTMGALARLSLPVVPRIERIGESALRKIRDQAHIQVQGREENRELYEFLDSVEAGRGLAALPPPSDGDIFLDFEGAPYAFDGGLEYLVGMVMLSEEANATPVYTGTWAFDPSAEKEAFERFVRAVMKRWERYPDLHIYHYAPYEPTAIKRLTCRHSTCVDEVDRMLRAGLFIDVYHIFRQALRASVESYSIKKLEPLYGFTREMPLRDATAVLQAFETALALDDAQVGASQLMTPIEAYNRDDCLSAFRLREWLEARRDDLEARSGQTLPRPAPKTGRPTETLAVQIKEVAAIAASLTADLPSTAERTNEDQARWLLAQLLDWHRREEKSAWWEYFRLCTLTDEELQEDKNAMGGLLYFGEVGHVKKSVIHRYWFPHQDHSIDRAPAVDDPRTQRGVGEVVAIDERNCTIDIKRTLASTIPHPTALIPHEVVGSTVLRDSLLRLGSWVAEHGVRASGQFQAARHLLLRGAPRLREGDLRSVVAEHKDTVEAAVNLAILLERSVLPIQGPPGSGKTYTGARMIVRLVLEGRRVGITAVNHKVIGKLLGEVCKAARDSGLDLHAVQKVDKKEEGCSDAAVKRVNNNRRVFDALSTGQAQVAAGTAWLWSRQDMAETVDVLFVDEAGQMSLPNVLAVSQAAGSVVLLGDPQQLEQPQRGVHPPSAELSALAHLLKGRSTIDEDHGLFLHDTWRLHPDVCDFISELFYDGRFVSRTENANQRINAAGPLGGAGLRFAPVEHTGNQSDSPEEVERVVKLVEGLLDRRATWTDKDGQTTLLKLGDILVVTPYNAQVSELARRLPEGARVGTVDKFQGQEASLVLYSMATSTPDDAPRGMEFLYSLNRLNVAISRARCVAALVASPALFQVQCKTPRQMELANGFCRYIEMAQPI